MTTATRLPLRDGDVVYEPGFLSTGEADRLLRTLLDEVEWRQDVVRMFGRAHEAPRRTAWIGDPGCTYTYSGSTWSPRPFTPALAALRERLRRHVPNVPWNAVLLNRYRDGDDSMGWHSDDEPELGPDPWVASVSLGATRTFQLRHRTDRSLPRVDVELEHGSLLLMAPPTQAHWKHALPRRRRVQDERVNLTFRYVIPSA